jgi:hypothetical protein
MQINRAGEMAVSKVSRERKAEGIGGTLCRTERRAILIEVRQGAEQGTDRRTGSSVVTSRLTRVDESRLAGLNGVVAPISSLENTPALSTVAASLRALGCRALRPEYKLSVEWGARALRYKRG